MRKNELIQERFENWSCHKFCVQNSSQLLSECENWEILASKRFGAHVTELKSITNSALMPNEVYMFISEALFNVVKI